MSIPFTKYHGLGNDFLVIEETTAGVPSSEMVRRICDRRFGVGCDGIVIVTANPVKAPFGFRIFNSDGGEAEITGNGLRAYARHLFDAKRVSHEEFAIETLAGIIRSRVRTPQLVTIGMGKVEFQSDLVPVTGPSREVLQEPHQILGKRYQLNAAVIGNPHCVIFVNELSVEEVKSVGPVIERHELFPRKANVHFVKVLSREAIQIESWERGAGYTLACGSGSSASVGVAKRLGLTGEKVKVITRGGDLEIDVGPDFEITLHGPVVRICSGIIDAECLK